MSIEELSFCLYLNTERKCHSWWLGAAQQSWGSSAGSFRLQKSVRRTKYHQSTLMCLFSLSTSITDQSSLHSRLETLVSQILFTHVASLGLAFRLSHRSWTWITLTGHRHLFVSIFSSFICVFLADRILTCHAHTTVLRHVCRVVCNVWCILPKKCVKKQIWNGMLIVMGNRKGSRDQRRHEAHKGQGRDSNTVRAKYLENSWRSPYAYTKK